MCPASCYPLAVRILAIDFGERRIGLATSDATGTLATPRRTVTRRDDEAAVAEILRFCGEEEIGLILVGIPRSPEGEESAFASRIRSFASKLAGETPIPVRFHEETLTSNEAARRLPPGFPKEKLDSASAAVLLEDYLRHRESAARHAGGRAPA
jgi:putative Holliday junction resolvase